MENKNIKIAVMMPVHFFEYTEAEESYLIKSIDSILNQTHDNFIFHIMLDGNFPRAQEIIERYQNQDNRINLIISEHIGLCGCLNYMLSLVNEPYILRQDADDISREMRAEVLLDVINGCNKIGAIGDNYGVINSSDRVIHINTADPETLRLDRLAGSIAGASMLRTKAVKEVGGWKYKYAQDFYMLVKLRQAGYIIKSIKETVYYYRQHKNQISQKVREEQKACHREIVEKEINGK